METRLLVFVFVVCWALCAGVEVTQVNLVGKEYATVQDRQVQVTCHFKLGLEDGGSQVSFTKNAQNFHSEIAASKVNPKKVYTVTAPLTITSRADEGTVSCTVKNNEGTTSTKQLMVFVADTPVTNNKYALDSMSKQQCVVKMNYASVASDPPLETTCGIWLINSTKWLEDGEMKGSYWSENGDFEKVREAGKKSSYKKGDVLYKLNQLPADQRLEHRCVRAYKFGSDETAVKMRVDSTVLTIQEPFKHKCHALTAYEEPEFNVTVEHSFKGKVDCQDTWSTNLQEPITGKLTCGHDQTSLSVQCEQFRWKEVEAEGEASDGEEDDDDDDAEKFAEKCKKLGNTGAAPFASLALLMASAVVLSAF